MHHCPKCDGSHISRPEFIKFGFAEWLKYTCLRCGYSERRPCADAKRQADNAPQREVPAK